MDLEFFFSPDRPVAYGLNTIIIGATVAGVAMVIRALLQLRAENNALDTLSAIDPTAAEQGNMLRDRLMNATIVLHQLDLMQALKLRSRAIDDRSLAGLAEDALHDRVATPLFLRSTLVLLGLAGTLWGLSLSITDLAGFLSGSVSSVEDMKNAILGTLSGMETAFSTTLAGVVGAILVSAMTRIYDGGQSAFLQRLEHFSLATLIPLYDTSESSVLDAASQRLEKLTASMEGRLDDLLHGLAERGDQLTSQVRAAVDQFVDTFANRSKALLKEIAEIRERTLEIFGTPAEDQKSLAEQVSGFTMGIEALQQTTGAVQRLIPGLSAAITAAIDEQRAALEAVLTAESLEVKHLVELQKQWGEQLAAATEKIAEGQDEFVHQSGELASAAREFNQSWERIEGSLKGTEMDVAQTVESLRDGIRETLKEVSASYEATHTAVLLALRDFEAGLSETQAAIAAEPRRAIRQSSELLEELDRVVKSILPELAQTMAQAGTAGSIKVERAVQELTREIRSLPAGNGRGLHPANRQEVAPPVAAEGMAHLANVDPEVLDDLREVYQSQEIKAPEDTE